MTNVFTFVNLDISEIMFRLCTEKDCSDECVLPNMTRIRYTNWLLLGNDTVSFSVTQQPKLGLGSLIVEVSIRHAPSRTSLNEWPTRRNGCYLHDAQLTQQKNIHAHRGIEPAIPAIKRLQTYALDRTVTTIITTR
jgi:hypothetical protein